MITKQTTNIAIFCLTGLMAVTAIGETQKDPTHTANFGVKLQERCLKLGLECELMYPRASNVRYKTSTDYLIATLKSPAEESHDE